jgi:predicted site-specific integrase-resolvase
MTTKPVKRVRCAVYTRVSTEYGLDQEFNSLDAQHEAAEAYVRSQAHDGWTLIRTRYDDGGYSGGSTERPALQRLLADIRDRRIDIVVVYKVDRLTRSLADFAKLVELFDGHGVSFVSVTQQFNTTTSMGRLTLNVLLSFAQFEREVTSERIRDKSNPVGVCAVRGMSSPRLHGLLEFSEFFELYVNLFNNGTWSGFQPIAGTVISGDPSCTIVPNNPPTLSAAVWCGVKSTNSSLWVTVGP